MYKETTPAFVSLSTQPTMNQKARVSKELNSKHQKILEGLLKLPENRECADCKSIAPRWASVNLGIFICMRCSGIHRSLGVHISKVRSATLDTWLPDQIALIQSMGNAKSNSYWESELPPNYDRVGIESFILAKYKDKRWIPRGVKAIPSARVREVKQLHHKEVNSNVSGNEHRNNIPKSSDEKEDSQSHNTDTNLPSSNSRELVAQTISKPEHQKSESQVLEKKLEDIKTNSITPNASDHFTLLPNHNSGVCGPKSLDAHDNTKMEIQSSTKEENIVSKELESKTPVKNGFEDLFQGLQWVAQPVPHESPMQVQNEKINNHSEKPSVSPQLPTHHSQLATQRQQESSAKTNGVPQARSEIRIQHNIQNVHKPVQNQGKTGNQVNVNTAQQIGAARPSYFVGNTATYMKSSMCSDGPASQSSIATSVRPQSASTKSLNIPTHLGGDYDFSSLVQGILHKR